MSRIERKEKIMDKKIIILLLTIFSLNGATQKECDEWSQALTNAYTQRERARTDREKRIADKVIQDYEKKLDEADCPIPKTPDIEGDLHPVR